MTLGGNRLDLRFPLERDVQTADALEATARASSWQLTMLNKLNGPGRPRKHCCVGERQMEPMPKKMVLTTAAQIFINFVSVLDAQFESTSS